MTRWPNNTIDCLMENSEEDDPGWMGAWSSDDER